MKSSLWTRSRIGFLIVFIGIVALLYRGIPCLSASKSYISTAIESTLRSHLSTQSFCTKAVGEGICCELHLKAEPCLDECRKTFMDRETFEPTKEYDECADQCLFVYQSTCGNQTTGQKSLAVDPERGTRMSRDLRRPRRRLRKPQ
jgi:hypothetical protein